MIKRSINIKGELHSFDKPLVMGIVNMTPDSFFDGGKYNDLDQAKFTLLRMANLSKQKEKRSSFFDSHPSNPERIAYFDKHRELVENGELFILD